MNVIGVLVHTAPRHETAVATDLAALPGVEVHAASDGRLVVTATDVEALLACDALMAMNQVPHVLGTSLVYHAFEPDLSEPEAGTALRKPAA